MQEIKQQIKELRPSLRQVAPLSWYIVLGFAVLNIVLGLSLIKLPVKNIAIISQYTPSWLYGATFTLLGLTMVWGMIRNNWKLMRRTMAAGLLLKAVFLYALILILLHGGDPYVLSLWLFLTYIQAMAYVFFVPVHLRGQTYGFLSRDRNGN